MGYEHTVAGKATKALYEAATKAGMVEELRRAQVEVFARGNRVHVGWEHELCENEEFVVPREAIARAEAWLKRYASKEGLEA